MDANITQDRPRSYPFGDEIRAFFKDCWLPKPQRKAITVKGRTRCEYCQDICLTEFHEHHKRICQYNPQNLREALEFANSGNIFSHRQKTSSQSSLSKIICEFCNEHCYVMFQENHKRVCPKNPDNIKMACRFCSNTLSLNSYHSHVELCGEKMQYKESSLYHKLEELGKKEVSNSSIENDLLEKECPICMEEIRNKHDLTELTCKHQFHNRCIQIWRHRQKKCPICRQEFL